MKQLIEQIESLTESRLLVTKHPIKLKAPNKPIPKGAVISWRDGRAYVHTNEGEKKRISALGAAKALGIKVPSMKALERWAYDSVVDSVMGERVEPDGIDHYGSPSWLMALGML